MINFLALAAALPLIFAQNSSNATDLPDLADLGDSTNSTNLSKALFGDTTEDSNMNQTSKVHLVGNPPAPIGSIFNVIIKTVHQLGAGTSAHVFIQFGDGLGHQVNAFLKGDDKFDRKALSNFKLKSAVPIPEVCSLVLGHDRAWAFSDWYVIADGLYLHVIQVCRVRDYSKWSAKLDFPY